MQMYTGVYTVFEKGNGQKVFLVLDRVLAFDQVIYTLADLSTRDLITVKSGEFFERFKFKDMYD